MARTVIISIIYTPKFSSSLYMRLILRPVVTTLETLDCYLSFVFVYFSWDERIYKWVKFLIVHLTPAKTNSPFLIFSWIIYVSLTTGSISLLMVFYRIFINYSSTQLRTEANSSMSVLPALNTLSMNFHFQWTFHQIYLHFCEMRWN